MGLSTQVFGERLGGSRGHTGDRLDVFRQAFSMRLRFLTIRDQNGNASATSLIPAAPAITNNVQSSGNGPLLFYGEGAGVLYEPDLGTYGAPTAVGGYLGFSIPGTKTEAAIGALRREPEHRWRLFVPQH
jgi:hypothetical protein